MWICFGSLGIQGRTHKAHFDVGALLENQKKKEEETKISLAFLKVRLGLVQSLKHLLHKAGPCSELCRVKIVTLFFFGGGSVSVDSTKSKVEGVSGSLQC